MFNNNGIYYVFIAALLIIFLEILCYFIIEFLRKKFQWLITSRDENPKIHKKYLDKFIKHGYDPELGWVRKPNTFHEEWGRNRKTIYHIDSKGSRKNTGHELLPAEISCYGDSFAFCRQVNDEETFQWYLSELTQLNVQNFGVGNYGVDQALIRIKKEYPKNPTKMVILGFVPDTIRRILCVWKHYHEFGNIFAFKPRFKVVNGKLTLIPNIIDKEDKFYNLEKYIHEIRNHDYFYNVKFKKEIIKFPYLYYIFRNAKRNLSLICLLFYSFIFKVVDENLTPSIYPLPMKVIMRRNLKTRVRLYQDKEVVNLLCKIIEEFYEYAKSNEFIPLVVILPQKDDILFSIRQGSFYDNFVKKINKRIDTLDLMDELKQMTNFEILYSQDDEYGGHYSPEGNKFIAEKNF